MKHVKRAIALVLAICMIAGPVPTVSFAEDEDGQTVEQTTLPAEVPADESAAETPAEIAPEPAADAETPAVEAGAVDAGQPAAVEASEGAPSAPSERPEGAAPEGEAPVQPEASDSAPELSASGHVQRLGWQAATRSGGSYVIGTTGRALRLEAFRLSVAGGSVSYKAHVRGYGWLGWASDGADAGTTGQARRAEAVRIRLGGAAAQGWSVQYRVHVQTYGWLGWAADGDPAGTTGFAKRLEAVEVRVVPRGTALPDGGGAAWRDAGLTAQAHVQRVGWQGAQSGYGVTVGTTGQALRMEALTLKRPAGIDLSGSIVYRAHVQTYGWQGWVADGAQAGTTGRAKRLEAVQIDLTGELASRYDVWYRVHVRGAGWLGWTKNGGYAGTEGLALRMEAIQVALVGEGQDHPAGGSNVSSPFIKMPNLTYTAGNAASGAALGSFMAKLSDVDGLSVAYSAHVTSGSWTAAASNGAAVSGGTIEAIRMTLGGEKSRVMNIWYRAYIKGVGWTSWAKNGQEAGSIGLGKPIVAVQARVLSYCAAAPSNGDAAIAVTCSSGSSAQSYAQANATQRRIVQAARSTPWPGPGLCAGWVESVYSNAGVANVSGDACDLYDWYCRSANVRDLKVGMIVAVRTHTHTYAGSIWGHVGLYIGDGWIMHSVANGVERVALQDWINYYGTTYTPKWGWLGNARVI